MRDRTDAAGALRLVAELGRLTRQPATAYLVGGATAVIEGWRATTIDVDLYLEPDRDELLRLLPPLKERLAINIELASPLDFLPELPGWRDRSPFVAQEGALTVRHFDFYAQALAKIERGFDQDAADVRAMIERHHVHHSDLQRLFEAIEPQLYRFPAIDVPAFRADVARYTRGS